MRLASHITIPLLSLPISALISDGSDQTATDPTSGDTGSFDVSLDSSVSQGTASSSGTLTASASLSNSTAITHDAAGASWNIVIEADSNGTLVVNYSSGTASSPDEDNTVIAYFSAGNQFYYGIGTYTIPVTKGMS